MTDATGPTQTALIVPVPEAEPVVGRLRATLDAAAAKGVPAHVTVLFPFLPPAAIDAGVLATLRETFAAQEPFDVTFSGVRWFDDRVAWLAPEPDQAFQQLTAEVFRRFPQNPPYGGKHDALHPHLTLGHDQPLDVLTQAASEVSAALPMTAGVRTVHLIAGSDAPNSWQTLHVFALGHGK